MKTNFKVRILGAILAIIMVLSSVPFTVFAIDAPKVAKVGDTEYDTLFEALKAAKGAEVTVTGYKSDATVVPSGYVADENSKTITINDMEAFLYFVLKLDLQDALTKSGKDSLSMYYGSDCGTQVILGCDLDFENATIKNGFDWKFPFNGNEHTIKNLKVSGDAAVNVGLFKAAHPTDCDAPKYACKNLILDNITVSANVSGDDDDAEVGILFGHSNCDISNITINNSSVTNGKFTGGVVGHAYCNILDCSLDTVSVSGQYKVGGITGFTPYDCENIQVTGNTLKDVSVSCNNKIEGKTAYVGTVVGQWYSPNGECHNNTFIYTYGDKIGGIGEDITVNTTDEAYVAQIGSTKYSNLHDALVACKSNETVELLLDVNLKDIVWETVNFYGTFDGKNHTISNLTVSGESCVAFVNTYSSGAIIKNVTFNNATITATGNSAAVVAAAGFRANIIDVNVTNSTVTAGGEYAGAISSGNYPTITNCKVDNCSIKGKEQVGGLAGYVCGECITGCTVSNSKVEATVERAGGLVGKYQLEDSAYTVKCNDNTVTNTVVKTPNNAGGLIGQIMGTKAAYEIKNNSVDVEFECDGTKNPIATLRDGQNAAFTGALSLNITGNWWSNDTLDSDKYEYSNEVVSVQTIYRCDGVKIGNVGYKTLDLALAAVKDGETISLEVGTFESENVGQIANLNGKTFSIIGKGSNCTTFNIGKANTEGEGAGDYRFEGATVTFENMKIQTKKRNIDYLGFVRAEKLTFNNCAFYGRISGWGKEAIINNSVFESSDLYEYVLWTLGSNLTIKNTTFNTQGKAIKLYGSSSNLTVDNCTFNSNGEHASANKPAIAVANNDNVGGDYNLTITNCTQTGFVKGVIGTQLWGTDTMDDIDINKELVVNDCLIYPHRDVNVSTTVELQTALDNAQNGDTILVASGTYETVYLRNNGSSANRIMKNVIVKNAEDATVNIAQIAYQKVASKSLDIENLTIDGLNFNIPSKTAVLFNVDSGRNLRVNNLTIQNCIKVGNNSNGTTYDNAAFIGMYYDGATAIDATFAGDSTLTCGYHNIKVLNNTITKVLQPIKAPNDGPLYGLTVSGNSFSECQNNHLMLSTKTTGTVTVTNNTIDKMAGRFMRVAGAQSTAEFIITGNTVTNPSIFEDEYGTDIVKITGNSGFTVNESNNTWNSGSLVDGKWISNATPVAKIGNKNFGTLDSAIDGAQNGDTITLVSNIVLTNRVTIEKSINIDLGGYLITAANNEYAIVYDGYEASTDHSVRISGKVYNGKIAGQKICVYSADHSDVVVENITAMQFNGTGEQFTHTALASSYGATLTVSSGSFSGEYAASIFSTGGKLILNGGTFIGTKESIIAYCPTSSESEGNGEVIINGGNYSGPLSCQSGIGYNNYIAKCSITGGTFSIDPTIYVAQGYKAEKSSNNLWTVVKIMVAQIGEKQYGTLQEAIDDAQNGDTIKVIANIIGTSNDPLAKINGKTLTINLNGMKLEGLGCDGIIHALGGANVTIKGNGTIVANECTNCGGGNDGYAMAVYAIGSNTVVNIENGAFSNNERTNHNQYDLIYASSGATINIKGGTYKCVTSKWTLNVNDKHDSIISVTGGTFVSCNPETSNVETNDPNSFVASNYYAANNQNGTWTVKKQDTVVVNTNPENNKEVVVKTEMGNTSVTDTKPSGMSGDDKTSINSKTVVSGVELSKTQLTVSNIRTGLQEVIEKAKAKSNTEFNNAIEAKENKVVNVKVDVKVELKTTDYQSTADKKSITFDLTPTATVSVTTGGVTKTVDGVEVTNDMIDQSQDIYVDLYTGFDPTQIIHMDKDGKTIGVFNQGDFTYNEDTGVATVKIHHFSSLKALGGTNPETTSYVAEIGQTQYTSLDSALEAAKINGDTVKLLANITTEKYIIVESGVTLDLNGFNITNAKLIYVTGDLIDTAAAKGVVNATAYMLGSDESYFPIYNKAKYGYSFFDLQVGIDYVSSEHKYRFAFRNSTGEPAAAFELMNQNDGESRIKAVLTITWVEGVTVNSADGSINVEKTFTFTDSLFDQYVSLNNEKVLYATVTGLDTVTNPSVTAKFVSYDSVGNTIFELSSDSI